MRAISSLSLTKCELEKFLESPPFRGFSVGAMGYEGVITIPSHWPHFTAHASGSHVLCFKTNSTKFSVFARESWVCCNSCFFPPSADRKLAVTTCGHVICSVCYQKGQTGMCLICCAKCRVSPLSDKSSPEVKALFSDISVVATKHLTEMSKVIMFQARHQKRLLTHYQQKNEKLEELLVGVKQEMQQMTKKLSEQSAYITKLENALKPQSAKASSVHHISHSSHTPQEHKPVLQILYNSPLSLSRHSSATNITENMEVDERSLFRKPNSVSRVSFISSPQDGRTGTIPHRSSNPNMSASHSTCSATVSRFPGAPLTPDVSYGRSSGWRSPIFRPPSSFRHSMSSLVCPPP